MNNKITFHPHAWGDNAREMNRKKNPGVPDAYHEAIILRNAADYAARQLDPDYHPGRDATDEALGIVRCEHNFNPNNGVCMYCGEETWK